jgi:4-hydroxy 2-oxovalerate aldolase
VRVSVLDCTLRDGGNYNGWRFSESQIRRILAGLDDGRVDFVEVGYRGGSGSNRASDVGIAADFPSELLGRLPPLAHARLAIQAVPSVCDPRRLDDLVGTPVELVRVAAYPHDLPGALAMVAHVKGLGLRASLNVMAASYLDTGAAGALAREGQLAGADVLYLADSFGALSPDATAALVAAVREHATVPVGYHGHNNLGLAFANAIAALRAGATWLDCSLCGLARGAGNLPLEQLAGAALRWDFLETATVLEPLLATAELVLAEILAEPLRIARPEIESGAFNLHYYYHPLVRERAAALGLDPALLAERLGRSRPRRVDVACVDAAARELCQAAPVR